MAPLAGGAGSELTEIDLKFQKSEEDNAALKAELAEALHPELFGARLPSGGAGCVGVTASAEGQRRGERIPFRNTAMPFVAVAPDAVAEGADQIDGDGHVGLFAEQVEGTVRGAPGIETESIAEGIGTEKGFEEEDVGAAGTVGFSMA